MCLAAVDTYTDEFRHSVAVYGIVQLVLYRGVKKPGNGGILVVVDAGGVDVCNPLIKFALAEAYFAYFGQQAFKIIFPKKSAILKTFFVQHIAFDGKFLQKLCGPLAELRGADGIDAVAHGNDGIKVVEINLSRNLSDTLYLNYPEFPDSSILL